MHRCMPPCIYPPLGPTPFTTVTTTAVGHSHPQQAPLLRGPFSSSPRPRRRESTRSNVRVECQLFLSALSLSLPLPPSCSTPPVAYFLRFFPVCFSRDPALCFSRREPPFAVTGVSRSPPSLFSNWSDIVGRLRRFGSERRKWWKTERC